MDPLEEVNTTLRIILTSWITYLKLKGGPYHYLWQVVLEEHPRQNDNTPCGVYCLMFAEKYIFKELMRKLSKLFWKIQVGCVRCGMYWCHFSCMNLKVSYWEFISETWHCRCCQ